MERKEALNIIGQVVRNFKGTLQEHQALQQAMEILLKTVNTVESMVDKREPEKDKKK